MLSAAAIRLLAEKGLSAADIADVAEACEPVRSSAAVRQKRHRDKKRDERNERDVTRNVTPPLNEYISNPPDPVGTEVPTFPSLESRVVEAWNEGPGKRGATRSQRLDTGRRRSLAARVREHGEAAVFQAIRGIAVSDFHCGIGEKSYRTNLGWLLKSPEHFVAAMERAEASVPAAKPSLNPAEQAARLREQAASFRRIGREDDAADAERRAVMLLGQPPGSPPGRDRGGPARPIAQLVRNFPKEAAA